MQILDYGGPQVTVGGNIVFQFPNYDISLRGTPEYAGQGNGRRQSDPTDPGTAEQVSTRLIYKSPNGSWDGANFLLHPNYNYSYANNFYRNRFLISGKQQLDDCESSPMGDCHRAPYRTWTGRYEPFQLRGSVADESSDPFAYRSRITAKSDETMQRLYESRPSFRYAPTPLPLRPAKASASAKPDEKKERPKEILWQLDQSVRSSNETWSVRQAKSTARNRRDKSAQDSVPRNQVPVRMSPEPDRQD